MSASEAGHSSGGLAGSDARRPSRNKTLKSSNPELARYTDRLLEVDSNVISANGMLVADNRNSVWL